MVDCALDILNHNIAERSDATIVFRVSSPWLPSSTSYHRTLLGPARKSRKLPIWTEHEFRKYLFEKKSDEGTVLIFVEAVYSTAGIHELLKETSRKYEQLAGLGSFNAFNMICGIRQEENMRTVELKDVSSGTVIGTARIKFTSTVWPSLQQELWGKVTPESAFEQFGEKMQRLDRLKIGSLQTRTKKSDFEKHHEKIYKDSPDSPLIFSSSDTESVSEKKKERSAKPSTPDVRKDSSVFEFTRSGHDVVKQISEEARSSPLSPSRKLNRQEMLGQHELAQPRQNVEENQEAKRKAPTLNVSRRLAANFNAFGGP